MPSVNLYLDEETYARLAYLALQTRKRVVELVQEAVKKYIAEKEKELKKQGEV